MGNLILPSSSRHTNRFLAAALAIVMALTVMVGVPAPASAAEQKPQFKDVPFSLNFYTEISWLADQQVTTGYGDGNFRPKASVTREEIAAFMYRISGKPAVKLPSKSPFKDVKSTAKFYKEIVWLSSKGITTGWSDGTFRPTGKVTRQQIAAFLYRLEGKPKFTPPSKSPFKDMKTSSYFFKEVTWLAKTGITTGYSDKTFRPGANVSREEIAAFLYRGDVILDRDGTYKVGTDIKPGTYTAVVAGGKYGPGYCYWERRSKNGTDFAGIIENDGTASGRMIVTILPSDKYFETTDCSGWTLMRKTSPDATSFSDGMHAVGYHMKAGTYAAPTTKKGVVCSWRKIDGYTGDIDEVIDIDNVDGKPANVTLKAGQGFESARCGTWKRIGN